MQRSSSLKRYTRIRPRRIMPRRHKFTIRLTGQALADLRWKCWMRDLGHCVDCKAWTHFAARFDGDPLAYEMAHIKSKGASGSDTLDNVRVLCSMCHRKEHGGC